MDPGANQIVGRQKQAIWLSKIEMAAVVFNFALLHIATLLTYYLSKNKYTETLFRQGKQMVN